MSRRLLIPAAAVLAFAIACDAAAPVDRATRGPVPSPERPDTLVVGLVGTMSGPGSWRGDEAFEGADLAVQVLDRAVDDEATGFELVTLDDRGEEDRATELVRELARSPRTVGVIYAGPPKGLPPAAQALALSGIPAVLLYGDLYSARLLRQNLFQASPPLLWQARRIASYLLNDRRYRRIGALVERSLTGRTARRSLDQALGEVGGRRAVSVAYTHDDLRLRPLLQRLRRARVEALVVEGGPNIIGEVTSVLDGMGALYRGTAGARTVSGRSPRRRAGSWRPQLVGFDLAISPAGRTPPAGTVAAAPIDRGAHFLPLPWLREFRRSFEDWWGTEPLGRQLRAYEAVRMIGWAARRAGRERAPEADLSAVLEGLSGRRFGGSEIVLGPDDHTTDDPGVIGLWVIPRPGVAAAGPPDVLPWVPLARGFSINGRRTDLPADYWRHLFRRPPPPGAPAPPIGRMRYSVATRRSDPLH